MERRLLFTFGPPKPPGSLTSLTSTPPLSTSLLFATFPRRIKFHQHIHHSALPQSKVPLRLHCRVVAMRTLPAADHHLLIP